MKKVSDLVAFCYYSNMNRASFALIKNQNNEILLVKSLTSRMFVNQWSLPGGVIEPYETLEDGVMREVFEEVGLVCDIKNQLRQIVNVQDNMTVTTFLAEYASGDIKLQSEEISDAQWFGVEDTESLLIGFNIRELFIYV
ncbi:NUDIX hydrolase [Candidatus Saccharibacteria bacterium]|nr:NUDIX hydrolase [Candidatus Saccharibacteria bacterium]